LGDDAPMKGVGAGKLADALRIDPRGSFGLAQSAPKVRSIQLAHG
jgi:hypothetical protein